MLTIMLLLLLLLFNNNNSYKLYYNKYNNRFTVQVTNNDIKHNTLYATSTSTSKYSNDTYYININLNSNIPSLSANDHLYKLSKLSNNLKTNTNTNNINKNKNKHKNKKDYNKKTISIAAKAKMLELKKLMTSNMKVNEMIDKINNILTLSLSNFGIHEFNFIITKFIQELNDLPQLRSQISDFIDSIIITYDHLLDIRTYSTILSSFLRCKDYKRSMDIFNLCKKKEMKLDLICYQGGIRAVSFLYPWNMTMDLLEEAYSQLDIDEIIEVVITAVTNLKYMETKESTNSNLESLESGHDLMEKANALLSWCSAHNINLTPKIIDAFISVACKHGNDDDVNNFVNVMINNNLKPTEVTFNTLLNKYAIDGKQNEAMSIIEMMRTWGYSPDIVTFNILLKLYKKVEDDKSVKETLLTMETFDIKKDEYSKSTLLQHFKNNLNSNEIVSIVNEENDEFMTPYIITNAITSCDSWQHSLKLLQRAVSLNKADAAVYTAAAQSCVSQGEFDAGFRVIELMLSNGINLNKKSLSFLLSSCLSPNLDSEICSKKLKKYMDLVSDKYPNLITNEVCQKLMKGLSFRGLSSLACSFHLGPLAHTTCKSETLSILLTEMQNSCNDNDNVEFRQSLARKSLALMALYCNSNSINNRLLLRTSHFNSVLRMLSLASMHNHCEQLFRFMSGHKNITFSNIERDDHDNNDDDKLILEENEVSKKLRVLWTPGTFTIAELVRAAKETTRPVLANDVIQWAVREGAFVPEGVVSDAVSFVYRVGRTDLSLSMYRSLYSVGHVQHWHDKDHLEMDLHNFSRGMAFAAIKVAIDEAKIIAKNKINRDLIIITGRSISRRSKDNNNNDEDDDLYGYKLSNEIQRVLIEDFYPPIDSATIPDNPGRLKIIIPNTD